jgi:hypothetical protein
VVFYRLFDTVTEAKEDVSNGQPISDPCPPLDQPVDIVCWYAVGPDKGLARFGYTVKGALRYYISRWVSNAEPQLRGWMSTETAEPQDWQTLQANWKQLVTAK